MKNSTCMNEQQHLMHIITLASFAMDDARLYLDTHPDDCEALKYYEKNREIRNTALDEHNAKFGPICSYDVYPNNYWNWNDRPLPWEVR